MCLIMRGNVLVGNSNRGVWKPLQENRPAQRFSAKRFSGQRFSADGL